MPKATADDLCDLSCFLAMRLGYGRIYGLRFQSPLPHKGITVIKAVKRENTTNSNYSME